MAPANSIGQRSPIRSGATAGTPLIKLAHVLPGDEPPYAAGFQLGHRAARADGFRRHLATLP